MPTSESNSNPMSVGMRWNNGSQKKIYVNERLSENGNTETNLLKVQTRFLQALVEHRWKSERMRAWEEMGEGRRELVGKKRIEQ